METWIRTTFAGTRLSSEPRNNEATARSDEMGQRIRNKETGRTSWFQNELDSPCLGQHIH